MKQHSVGFIDLVNQAKRSIQEIDIEQLKKMMTSDESFAIIDVREDSEWQQGHVPGAVPLSKGIIERDIECQFPDHDMTLVLYCGGGYRSALAAVNLQAMGYGNVFSLTGGFRAWQQYSLTD